MTSHAYFHAWLAPFNFLAVAILVITTGFAADAPKPPGNPFDEARDQMRKRIGDTKSWYGTVTISIRGSGHRSNPGEQSDSHYSVDHEATIKFTIPAVEGELGAVSAMEEAMKRMPNNPIIAQSFEKMRNLRHWITPLTNRKPKDEADVKSEVTLKVEDRFDGSGVEAREGGGGQKRTSYRFSRGSDNRKATLFHMLMVDFAKGTYDLTLDPKTDLLDITDGEGGSWKPETTTTRNRSANGVDLRFTNQKLPADGNILTGTMKIPKDRLQSLYLGSFGNVRGTITWTLSPTPLDDVELVLKPEGYDDWLPRGGKDEQTEGNTIRITALLRKRGGGGTDVKMKHITVRLDDVSTEPGVCLNLPITRGGMSPDLDFSTKHNAGVQIEDEGTRVTKKGSEFSELPVTVSCYDWGAWGSVVAQATLTDGREVWATLDGDPTTQECRLPKRDSDSKIADKWKSDMDVAGAKDEDDNEKQKGNKNDGDGLTLYEEYRGLIAKGKHTRDHPAGPDGVKPLTPAKKDLIVHNQIKNDSDVAAGLLLFEKASGIHIVEVDDGELPESRQVNINAGQITCGPQFGLLLVNESSGNAGLTIGEKGKRFDPAPSTPKGFPKVSVDIAAIKDDDAGYTKVCASEKRQKPFTLKDQISNTVAHELAHGVGVSHHGGRSYGSQYKQVTAQMTSWKVFDRDGAEIKIRPFDIDGGVANPGNEASGNVDCIMCYNSIYNWCYQDRAQTFFAVPIIAPGRSFCTDDKGTGPNSPRSLPGGKSLPGLFGDAAKGNCLSQMKVKDQ